MSDRWKAVVGVIAALVAVATLAVPADANVPSSYAKTFTRTIEGVWSQVRVTGYSNGQANTLTLSGPGGPRHTRQIAYKADGSSIVLQWSVGDTYYIWYTYRYAIRHQVCMLTPSGRYLWTIYVGGASSVGPQDYGVLFTAGRTSC